MKIGTGITISFSSSFFAEILDVSPPNASRESIATSHMGTSAAHTFMPADLVDWGELTVEMAFDPSTTPPITSAAEAIVITFADSAASTWSFSGYMTSFEPSAPLEDRMTASATIKVTGAVTVA
jgi:hypothetical protein